ncbi:aldose 1-epimerase family protein [Micromonospora sp. NPDC005163]
MSGAAPLSGTQHTIRAGHYTATIASVGASLRVLRFQARDLVVPFEADQVRPAYRGAALAPWPNRVVDGRYTFAGLEQILALTEPSRGHALHGLAAWLDFKQIEKGSGHVVLATTIEAQAGYPFQVGLETTYALNGSGLTQTVRATNLGAQTAPFGTGPHPYLVAGPDPLDAWTLELPADQVSAVTADRLIPTGMRAVDEDEPARFDFRVPRRIADARIDHAFTDLRADANGRYAVRVTNDSGSGVQMTWDHRCRWVQVHTADLPGTTHDRVGLAVEPMTCPPDAFNSHRDLILLDPGESTTVSWTIAAIESSADE